MNIKFKKDGSVRYETNDEEMTHCPECEFEWTEPTNYIIGHYCLCNEDCDDEKDKHYCYKDSF